METLTTKLLDYLKGQSFQVAVVFIAVLILTWLLRNRSAHVRYLLWLLVAIKCLTPPMMIFSVPVLPNNTRTIIELPMTVEVSPQTAAQESFAAPTPEKTRIIPVQLTEAPKISPLKQFLSAPANILLCIWAAGGAFYLLWAAAKAVRLQRWLKQNHRPVGPHLAGEIEELTRLWNPNKAFTVRLLDNVSQPFVWGLWRGAIYLPSRIQSIQTDRQKAVVMHEMAHVIRWDSLLNLIQILIQGLFWFHPLVWLANRFIRQEREKCCDETAIARLNTQPKEYGSAIIETLVQEYHNAIPIPSLAVAGPIKNIEDRIKTIMQPGRQFFRRPSIVALLIIGCLAVLVVPTTIALTQKNIPPDYPLSGVVVDAATGKPIAGAIVFDNGYGPEPYQKGISDADGKFEYKSWNEEHNVAAKAEGYESQSMTFTTFPFDNSKKLNFKLQPEQKPIETANSKEDTAKNQIESYLDVLRNGNVKEIEPRLSAIKGLIEIGSPAVPAICDELRKTESPRVQSYLAFALRGIGDASAVPALIEVLSRAGFSSDYGFGSADTDLGKFIQKYQIDPSSNSIGIGRPVREITIALERLTGHTEGKDHFIARDDAGKPLTGSYVITPEIQDRQRASYREAAKRWERWWQDKQKSEANPGGLLAVPEGSELELHIIPEPLKDTWPQLSLDDVKKYKQQLITEGSFRGSIRGDSYQWYPVVKNVQLSDNFVSEKYNDQLHVLVCARQPYSMWPDGSWKLKNVKSTQDSNGHPAILIELDDQGAKLLKELTKQNIEKRLAFIIDGRIISAPIIMTAISKQVMITGNFTNQEISNIVQSLLKGMPPQNEAKQIQAKAATADNPKFKKRFFVTLVADKDNNIFSDGQKVTFEQLEAMMSKTPDPARTVLEVAFEPGALPKEAQDELSRGQAPWQWLGQNPLWQKAGQLVQKYHLEYPSFTGEDHPESRRAPLSIRIEDTFVMDKDIAVAMPALSLQEDKSLLTVDTVRFAGGDPVLAAKLDLTVISYPQKRWQVKMYLRDKNGGTIETATKFYQNSGVIKDIAAVSKDLLFFNFSKRDLSTIARFEIELRQVQNAPLQPAQKTEAKNETQNSAGAATLEFRVVPDVGKNISEGELKKYKDILETQGPNGDLHGYKWVAANTTDDTAWYSSLPNHRYKDAVYILLCDRPDKRMLADGTWGLQKVSVDAAGPRYPSILAEFDDEGGSLFQSLTQQNIDQRLALIVDGKVISAPQVKSPISKKVVITGNFANPELAYLTQALIKGMPPAGPKVTVEAKFMLVDEAVLKQAGIDLNKTRGTVTTLPADSNDITDLFKNNSLENMTLESSEPNLLIDPQSKSLMEWVRYSKNSTTLTAPKVLVRNKENATIEISTTEYMDTNNRNKTFTKGVQLTVCPQIDDAGKNIAVKVRVLMSDLLKPDTQQAAASVPQAQVLDVAYQTTVPSGMAFWLLAPQGSFYHSASPDENVTADRRLLILIKPTITTSEEQTNSSPSSGMDSLFGGTATQSN